MQHAKRMFFNTLSINLLLTLIKKTRDKLLLCFVLGLFNNPQRYQTNHFNEC